MRRSIRWRRRGGGARSTTRCEGVFNVGGNRYRLVVEVQCRAGIVREPAAISSGVADAAPNRTPDRRSPHPADARPLQHRLELRRCRRPRPGAGIGRGLAIEQRVEPARDLVQRGARPRRCRGRAGPCGAVPRACSTVEVSDACQEGGVAGMGAVGCERRGSRARPRGVVGCTGASTVVRAATRARGERPRAHPDGSGRIQFLGSQESYN